MLPLPSSLLGVTVVSSLWYNSCGGWVQVGAKDLLDVDNSVFFSFDLLRDLFLYGP